MALTPGATYRWTNRFTNRICEATLLRVETNDFTGEPVGVFDNVKGIDPNWPEDAEVTVSLKAIETIRDWHQVDYCEPCEEAGLRSDHDPDSFGRHGRHIPLSVLIEYAEWGERFTASTVGDILCPLDDEPVGIHPDFTACTKRPPTLVDLEVAQDLARFATFGPEVDWKDVPGLVRAGRLVWSYGYGQDDDFTVITTEDLWAWSEGERDVIRSWEPFRLDLDDPR